MRPERAPVLLAGSAVGLLTAAALVQRLPGLGPASLWLDDQWVGVLAAAAPASYVLAGSYPCPPGFVLLLRALASLLGPGESALQLLPLAAGLAAIPLVALLAFRVTGMRSLGVLAAALLAGNPTLAVYSLRVKPFAVDALATTLLLLLAEECRRAGTPRRFAALVLAAVLLPWFSFPSFLVGTILVIAVAAELLRGRPDRRRWVLGWVAAAGVAAVALWAGLLRRRGTPSLRQHWRDFYLPFDDPGAALGFLRENGARLLTHAFPDDLGWAAVLVPLGLAALLSRKRDRALGIALGAVYAAHLVLSARGSYPLGGGRTDAFGYPLSILAAVAAVAWLCRRTVRGFSLRWLAPAAALLAVVHGAVRFPATSYRYPESGAAAVVARAASLLAPGDGLVIYPWTNWAVGLYGEWPVEVMPVTDSTNGFYVRPVRKASLVLRESHRGAAFQSGPEVVRGQLEPFLRDSPARLVYLADRGPRPPHVWIVEAILGAGYRLDHQELHHGAILMVFERGRAPGGGA